MKHYSHVTQQNTDLQVYEISNHKKISAKCSEFTLILCASMSARRFAFSLAISCLVSVSALATTGTMFTFLCSRFMNSTSSCRSLRKPGIEVQLLHSQNNTEYQQFMFVVFVMAVLL